MAISVFYTQSAIGWKREIYNECLPLKSSLLDSDCLVPSSPRLSIELLYHHTKRLKLPGGDMPNGGKAAAPRKPRNILIYSDGTGQRGGLYFDEARTNIYKLFRATRVAPDSTIDPDK